VVIPPSAEAGSADDGGIDGTTKSVAMENHTPLKSQWYLQWWIERQMDDFNPEDPKTYCTVIFFHFECLHVLSRY